MLTVVLKTALRLSKSLPDVGLHKNISLMAREFQKLHNGYLGKDY